MDKLFLIFLFFTSSIYSQDCNSGILKSTVKNEFKSLPIEGAKYVSINNCRYIIGVGITSSPSKNLSMLNRVASVKARRSVVLLLGNPKVTTQSFLKTEQIITDNTSSYIESFVDETKEEASSFVQGMETLDSFYSNDGKTYVYILFKKI
tara:strand:+ start:187 stop:636 length:450 start_codon:yes stop_codon:yes gene_type:complete